MGKVRRVSTREERLQHVEGDTLRDIESVLGALTQKKAEVVEELFGHSTPDYKAEWMRREPFAFYCHLDRFNQRRVVVAARKLWLTDERDFQD